MRTAKCIQTTSTEDTTLKPLAQTVARSFGVCGRRNGPVYPKIRTTEGKIRSTVTDRTSSFGAKVKHFETEIPYLTVLTMIMMIMTMLMMMMIYCNNNSNAKY
jgi:hypothetical protein